MTAQDGKTNWPVISFIFQGSSVCPGHYGHSAVIFDILTLSTLREDYTNQSRSDSDMRDTGQLSVTSHQAASCHVITKFSPAVLSEAGEHLPFLLWFRNDKLKSSGRHCQMVLWVADIIRDRLLSPLAGWSQMRSRRAKNDPWGVKSWGNDILLITKITL